MTSFEKSMSVVTFDGAISRALAEEMRRDARVILFGQGAATARPELQNEFGSHRVRNAPASAATLAGTAVGAAASGLRPVIDLQAAPFLASSMHELINYAGKLRYLSGGQFEFPLVVLAAGPGSSPGAPHDHGLEAMFMHAPGLKIVVPSNPRDASGLLKAAIRDENPVIFFVERALSHALGEVLESEHLEPIGKGTIARKGTDITLVSYGKTVRHCLQAAEELAHQGFDAEVIDLRTLKPLDECLVLRSVHKTGRLIIVHEAHRTCGVGAELAAIVSEKAFDALTSPIVRLTGPDAPAAAAATFEHARVPQAAAIRDAALRLVEQAAAA